MGEERAIEPVAELIDGGKVGHRDEGAGEPVAESDNEAGDCGGDDEGRRESGTRL